MALSSWQKTFFGLLTICLLLGTGVAWFLYDRYRVAPEPELTALPVRTYSGEAVATAEWIGQPTLVTFWQTWCPPCRTEMPVLAGLQQSVDGLRVVVLSDEPVERLERLSELVPEGLPAYRVPSLKELDVFTYPTSVLYNASGEVLYKTTGVLKLDADALQVLLAEAG